jgi:hypothetical protein
MTSSVIEAVGDVRKTAASPKPKPMTNGAQLALRALHGALGKRDGGEIPPASTHIPAGVKTVTLGQWRDYAFKIGISGSDDEHAKRTAFRRSTEALLAARKIGIWDPYLWPVYEDRQ